VGKGCRMTTKMYRVAFRLSCLESYLKSLFINMGLSVKEAEDKLENAVSEGEKCAYCGWRPGDKPTEAQRGFNQALQQIELNHKDGDPNNNKPSNLNLLCKSCNLRGAGNVMSDVTNAAVDGRPKGSVGLAPSLKGVDSECARANETEREEEEKRKQEVERTEVYAEGSSEMRVNIKSEREWIDLMFREIGEKGSIPEDYANKEFARRLRLSSATTKRYLDKYKYDGPFMVIESEGVPIVVFRKQYRPIEEVKR
jgi:hypothetical protein